MSSTALQHIPGGAVEATAEPANLPGQFTREQVELIKRTVAEGTSDDELALFLEVCRTTGLNPFQRQIYAIMRQESYKDPSGQWRKRGKMTIQTGIDGYRLTASRTGLHAGTSDATYGPLDGDGYPEWATVVVKKLMPGGHLAEFSGTARWAEYVQLKDEYVDKKKTGRLVPSGQWPKMPFLMLGKCAESLALRRAFPAELAGVYTREEMSQADVEDAVVEDVTPARPQRRGKALAPRDERDDFPGEQIYGGPRAAAPARQESAPQQADERRAGDISPDALMQQLDERLALVATADEATLKRWFEQAREEWPEPMRSRLCKAIHIEAQRRTAQAEGAS